jgi:hypothetical protein
MKPGDLVRAKRPDGLTGVGVVVSTRVLFRDPSWPLEVVQVMWSSLPEHLRLSMGGTFEISANHLEVIG